MIIDLLTYHHIFDPKFLAPVQFLIVICATCKYTGAAEPGGSGGVGPPLEFEIYLVKFLKNCKKKGFFSIGPPLGKNRSSAPVNTLNL